MAGLKSGSLSYALEVNFVHGPRDPVLLISPPNWIAKSGQNKSVPNRIPSRSVITGNSKRSLQLHIKSKN